MNKSLDVPYHVAVVMDGNRRWARQRNLPDINGHKAGVEKIKELVKAASKTGVKHLTFWAFSTENWSRSKDFLKDIFWLFRHVLNDRKDFFEELTKNGGRIHILGDISKFPKDIREKINEYLTETPATEKTIDINFALNYGGRDELLRASERSSKKAFRQEKLPRN